MGGWNNVFKKYIMVQCPCQSLLAWALHVLAPIKPVWLVPDTWFLWEGGGGEAGAGRTDS
jgi:hypothetical protein